MKFVFFGTPRFAAIVLRGLLGANIVPVAIVCNPDRPVGRKKIVTPPPVKELALEHAIKVLQPEVLDEKFMNELRALDADFFVVAAYAKIIRKTILDIPRLGTLGVHPSLLPRYRGSSPIQAVILNGEKETGVTIYLMDEKMDHGAMLSSGKLPLDSLRTNYLELEEKLAEQGVELLVQVIPDFFAGKIKGKTQSEAEATFTKKFVTQDGFVDEADLTAAERGDTKKAATIVRKINALNPEPGAWTTKNGKRTKLLKAEIGPNGALKLTRVQEEGTAKPRTI